MRTDVTKPAILWAVDPFQTDLTPDRAAVATLLSWADQSGYGIKPVYVLSKPAEALDVMSEEEKCETINRLVQKTQQYMAALGVSNPRKTRILICDSRKKKFLGKELADYARKMGSPWIAVSSHGHTGLNRALFGSFAESALRYSKEPIFFLSHCKSAECAEAANAKQILFPTDLSLEAHAAFRRVLKIAKSGQKKISLFYANVWPNMAAGIEVPIIFTPDFMQHQEDQAKAAAEKWIKEAHAAGVEAEMICSDPVSPYDIASSILQAAKSSKAGLICLSCTSGQLSALLNGSVSRDVFRKSDCPVLVFGPQSIEVAGVRSPEREVASI